MTLPYKVIVGVFLYVIIFCKFLQLIQNFNTRTFSNISKCLLHKALTLGRMIVIWILSRTELYIFSLLVIFELLDPSTLKILLLVLSSIFINIWKHVHFIFYTWREHFGTYRLLNWLLRASHLAITFILHWRRREQLQVRLMQCWSIGS